VNGHQNPTNSRLAQQDLETLRHLGAWAGTHSAQISTVLHWIYLDRWA